MKTHRGWFGVVVAVVLTCSVVTCWWWDHGTPAARRSATPSRPRTPVPVSAFSEAMAPAVTVPDPASSWAVPSSARWLVTATATQFVRTLLSAPPGGPDVAARCAALVTPSLRATLAVAPGAPALAAAAQPVVVTGVVATIDDWAPGKAGVALGVSVRAGADGPPALLAVDVRVVLVAGRWLVGGIQL